MLTLLPFPGPLLEGEHLSREQFVPALDQSQRLLYWLGILPQPVRFAMSSTHNPKISNQSRIDRIDDELFADRT